MSKLDPDQQSMVKLESDQQSTFKLEFPPQTNVSLDYVQLTTHHLIPATFPAISVRPLKLSADDPRREAWGDQDPFVVITVVPDFLGSYLVKYVTDPSVWDFRYSVMSRNEETGRLSIHLRTHKASLYSVLPPIYVDVLVEEQKQLGYNGPLVADFVATTKSQFKAVDTNTGGPVEGSYFYRSWRISRGEPWYIGTGEVGTYIPTDSVQDILAEGRF